MVRFMRLLIISFQILYGDCKSNTIQRFILGLRNVCRRLRVSRAFPHLHLSLGIAGKTRKTSMEGAAKHLEQTSVWNFQTWSICKIQQRSAESYSKETVTTDSKSDKNETISLFWHALYIAAAEPERVFCARKLINC